MPEFERAADSRSGAPDDVSADVLIVIVRSGGLAGVSRRWRVKPGPAEQSHWTTLIERCPWHDPLEQPDAGADRFTWTVEARTPVARLQRQLPESAVIGAWRELVDAVRAASAPDTGDTGPAPSGADGTGLAPPDGAEGSTAP